MATLYSIHWKSKLTGAEGHGDPLEKSIADAWMKHDSITGDETCNYWLEPVEVAAPA